MEECIEILENYLDYNEQLKKDYSETAAIEEKEIEAISNLLTKYKQLEKDNKQKSIQIICYQEELEDSIPKSKVKEKIKELEEEKANFFSQCFIEERDNKIEVLQELLR